MNALELPYYPIIDVDHHPLHIQNTSLQKANITSFREKLKEKYKEILSTLLGYYEETSGPIDNITEVVNYRTRYTKYFTMLEKYIEYPADNSSKKISSLWDKNDTLLSISESIHRSDGSASFVNADYDDRAHMYRKICIHTDGENSKISIYDSEGEISSYSEH